MHPPAAPARALAGAAGGCIGGREAETCDENPMSLLPRQVFALGTRTRWAIWGIYVAAWTTALLTPHPVRVAEAVLPEHAIFPTSKALHIGAYAGMAILSAWLRVPGKARWGLLLFLSFHTMATEYLQGFVPTRVPSWGDVLIDHVGLALGLLVSWRWWRAP
jgi:VanZ family protein